MVSFHIVPVIVYLIVRVISYAFRFKCEVDAYLDGGSGITLSQINNTPHSL